MRLETYVSKDAKSLAFWIGKLSKNDALEDAGPKGFKASEANHFRLSENAKLAK